MLHFERERGQSEFFRTEKHQIFVYTTIMEEEDGQHKIQMQAQPADLAILALPPSETQRVNNQNKTIIMHNTPAPAPAPTKLGGSSSSSTRKTRAATARASSRCTRSQAAPQWTIEETLVLVSKIAALDEDWLKALSSYQRWKMIADNCVSMDVMRSSNQCKRRWESLLSDYKKIRMWESNYARTSRSYWSLQPATRKQLRLPASFDHNVFGSMDAVIKAQEARIASAAADTDSEDLIGLSEVAKDDSNDDSEDTLEVEAEASDYDYRITLPEAKGQAQEIIGMLDAEMAAADADSASEETGATTSKSANKELEITNELHKNAEKIHAILRGELPDNVSHGRGPVDLTRPNAMETEFTKWQADELIKAFGVLVSTLDQFTELIKDGECEGISLMN